MLIGFALSMTMHINFAYYQIVACRSYLWLLLLFTGRDDRWSPQQQYIRRSFWLKPCIRFKFCLENQIHCVLSLTISFSRTRKKITLYMFFVFITQLALLRIPLISRDERVGWNVVIHNRPYLSKRKLGLIFNGPGPADWSVILYVNLFTSFDAWLLWWNKLLTWKICWIFYLFRTHVCKERKHYYL